MELVPTPNSRFVRVKCPECGEETIVFNHAKTEVTCQNKDCAELLAKPQGGKAEIFGEITEVLE